MPDVADDGYEAYYADKLWALLPAIYRTLDPPDPDATSGPLREMVDRIGAQLAVVRRSIDRMWQDQSIETCDDWVIPYIGELLGVQLPAVGQRVDVAKTIYFRRRKGTLPVLEEIATEFTGWDTRVVEFFRRVARTRHGLDPRAAPHSAEPLVGRRTGTPQGGIANLRDFYGASRAQSAFDEFSHTVDLRRGRGRTGWQGIPRLGVFLFRTRSFGLDGVTAVADARRPREFTFDPTGREVPLYAASARTFGREWRSPEEHQLPVAIGRALLASALEELVPDALRIYEGGARVATSQIAGDPRHAAQKYLVDPARGRVRVPASTHRGSLVVGYHYGFSSSLGAGGYDRRASGRPLPAIGQVTEVSGGGAISIGTPDPSRPVTPRVASGTIAIADSRTYVHVPDVTIAEPGSAGALVVVASNGQRPVLRPDRATSWPSWKIVGTTDARGRASRLVVDGLLISGPTLELAGVFEEVILSTSTLDPGAHSPDREDRLALAVDGQILAPTRLRVVGQIRRLVIDRCILGPIVVEGKEALVEEMTLHDSLVQAVRASEPAISIDTGRLHVVRSTVLGPSRVHRLEAADSIFAGQVSVADHSDGCMRFSAYPRGSFVPKPYECAHVHDATLFASRSFGHATYAQLVPTADPRIAAGAEDGSEMGAFSREKVPLKRRTLLAKYREHAPIELEPIFIEVT